MSEKDVVKKLPSGKKIEAPKDLTSDSMNVEGKPFAMWFESDSDEHEGTKLTNEKRFVKKLRRTYSPVLPRAQDVAHELISINNDSDRWSLTAEVWREIAPRCGGSFHYEHLSTGGEFITHLLVLMYILGPFLPSPEPDA